MAQRALWPIRAHNSLMAETFDPTTGEAGLTVAAVARRLGVAPATLRTWNRRYGIGPSGHESGAHRKYCPDDLARLEHMRRLVVSGVAPADAARQAQQAPVAAAAGQRPAKPVLTVVEGGRASAPGGGQVMAIPGATPAVRGLARSAMTLDTATCQAVIDENLDEHGVVWTWHNLLMPVLVAVGERWATTGRGVEVEHALTEAIKSALSARVRAVLKPVNARAVLLTGAPEEVHTLPIWATAAALAERSVAVRVLGERMPLTAISEAIRRTGPAAVFIWAHLPGTADASELAALPSFRPTPLILIAGSGWYGTTPNGIVQVTDLVDAVDRIEHSLAL